MCNKGSAPHASDWLRHWFPVTLSPQLLHLIPHAEAADPAVICTIQWNASEWAAPRSPLPLSGLGSTWVSVTGRNAARGSLGVRATCYANVINQWRPDCLRCDSEDLRVPAVHRYLPLLFLFHLFLTLFFLWRGKERAREGGKKKLICRAPPRWRT